jgi:uncharacterized protein with PIN domain
MVDHSGPIPDASQYRQIAEAKQADLRFVTDINLGTLARWLRILGCDTRFDRGDVNRDFLRRAQQEDRIVLTRKRDMANRQFIGRLAVIEHDHVRRQLAEVMEKVGLRIDMDRLYRRCALCNAVLVDVSRQDVEGLVPDYVYHQSGPFRRCPECGKIYWPGAHREKALQFLRRHTPVHLP